MSDDRPSIARFAVPLAAAAALAAVIVIVGWLAGSRDLITLGLEQAASKFNSMLAVVLGAIGVALRARRIVPRIAFALGALVALLGGSVLIEHVAGTTFIDELFVKDFTGLAGQPGRMSMNASLAFLLLGGALMLFDRERHGRWPAGAMALAAGVLGFVGLVGYAGGQPEFYTLGFTAPMAAPAAMMIIALAGAVVLARPERRTGLLLGTGPGARLARRVFPAALLAPVVLGVLRIEGEKAGLFDTATGTLMFALAMVVGLCALIYLAARSIDRVESERSALKAEADAAHERVRLILDTAQHAFVSIDAAGTITDWNARAAATFGWSREEAIGRPMVELIVPERLRQAHHEGMSRFMRTGQGPVVNRAVELDALHRRGHEFPIEITISPLHVHGEWTFNAFIQDIAERRRAEAALSASEARYRALANESPAGTYECDASGGRTFVSHTWCRITGVAQERALGWDWAESVHPADRERVTAAMRRAVEQGGRFDEEFRHVRPDDREVWVHSRAAPIRDDRGRITGFVGTAVDITERKRAATELARQIERYDTLLRASTRHGIISVDRGGTIEVFNEGAERMLGYPAHEVIGKATPAIFHVPEEIAARAAELGVKPGLEVPTYHARRGVAVTEEWTFVRRGGHRFPAELTVNPLYDEDGELAGFLGVCTDITERKEALAELEAQEARFRALATQAPGGIYEVDVDGRLIAANERFCRLTGLEEADMGRVRFTEVVHPDDRGPMAKTWARCQEEGEPFEMEYRLRHRDGTIAWVAGRATRVEVDGAAAGYFGAVLDITERRAIEAELRLRGQITDHMAEGVVLVRHSDDRIVFANSRFEEIFGYGPGEMDGLDVTLVNAPGDKDPADVTAEIQSAVAEDGFWTGDVRNVRKDGTEFWCHATVSVFEHPEHGVVSLSVQEDITERRQAQEELRRGREMLERSQAIGRVGSWEWDLESNRVSWSAKQFELYGYEPTDTAPEPADFMEVVHPDDRQAVGESMGRSMLDPGPFDAEYRVVLPGGSVRALRVEGDLVPGHARLLAGTTRDITAERQAQAAVREAEERFRGAFENAPIGMAELGLDGRFLSANEAMGDIVGRLPEELVGTSFASITHPDDLERDQREIDAMLSGQAPSRQVEKRYLHANGHAVWVQLNGTLVRDAQGEPQHFLIQVQDITDRRQYESELQHMADHDPLTGLLNRRSFERELNRHVANVERYGAQGAALVLDLDNFKYYNDTLGHHVGDELIVRMAHVLHNRLRETDVLARLGGDEFAVILPKEDIAGARLVANSLLECIRAEGRRVDAGRGKAITASIGIAMFDDEERLAGEDVLVNADLAMYDAKEAGRNRVAAYSSDEHPQARMKGRVKWVDQIRRALDSDGFTLLAQPIVDLAGAPCDRYELLLRMNGEHGELIPPGTFLYIAERLGWVNEIDRWVARRAIELLAELPDINLEVNLSGLSIGDEDLLRSVEERLARTGVDASRLTFEITETAAVANIAKAREFAERLSELGCQFALDDFGAGFGSFYYLKHLPFDFLKIDGEFVKGCVSSETDRLLIEAVVGIARGMGKRTVAEFVGDDESVRTLRALGVDLGQGYHLGRPTPLADLLGDRVPSQA